MFQGKVKKLTISVIMGVLLLVSPFYTVNAESVNWNTYTTDVIQYFMQLGFDTWSNDKRYYNLNRTINIPQHYQYLVDASGTPSTATSNRIFGWSCTTNSSGAQTCKLGKGTNVSTVSNGIGILESNYSYVDPANTYWTTNSYELPHIKNTNAYPTITGYNRSYSLYRETGRDAGDPIYLAFTIYGVYIHGGTNTIYSRDSESYKLSIVYQQITGSSSNTAYTTYVFEIKPNGNNNGDDFITLDFNNLEGRTGIRITPIFLGYKSNMPDDLKQKFGITTYTEMKLTTIDSNLTNVKNNTDSIKFWIEQIAKKNYDGTTSTQQTETELDSQSSVLDNSITSFNHLEDVFNSNFSADFNNIDFNNNFISNSNLVSSMSWVRTQFDRMTSNNVIGTFIQYTLLFGLGLLVIGLL